MAELRIYVTERTRRFNDPAPEFDMHIILGEHRICSRGFWCFRCHPPLNNSEYRYSPQDRDLISRSLHGSAGVHG